jgi:D-cysteine desulfhydrase family pyridoxal phosphate-dependent enzyme
MIEDRLQAFPRIQLGSVPTPLHHAPRLSAALGGPEIWFKRDDLTGFGLGGNKVRTLEYVIGDALERGADTLVTGGRTFSNHVRITLAACNSLGLQGVGVLRRDPTTDHANHFLDKLLGGSLVYPDVSDSDGLDAAMAEEADARRQAGAKPYLIPRGGATAVGCLGYAVASLELQQQLEEADLTPRAVISATGSGCTLAGLAFGAQVLRATYALYGITATRSADATRAQVDRLVGEAATLLNLSDYGNPSTVRLFDNYRGEGPGIPSPEGREAIELVARTEGILLDPVYSGKGMAGLVDLIRQGEFKTADRVVFLHTGGLPSVFDL